YCLELTITQIIDTYQIFRSCSNNDLNSHPHQNTARSGTSSR
ncbi:7792_t:CDS:1, partial [Racocetra fulgida]